MAIIATGKKENKLSPCATVWEKPKNVVKTTIKTEPPPIPIADTIPQTTAESAKNTKLINPPFLIIIIFYYALWNKIEFLAKLRGNTKPKNQNFAANHCFLK